MADAGDGASDIAKLVRKTDGERGNARAIRAIIAHARNEPEYDGADSSAGGRPRTPTPAEELTLSTFMVDEVGIARVSIPCCKKKILFLRRLSNEAAGKHATHTYIFIYIYIYIHIYIYHPALYRGKYGNKSCMFLPTVFTAFTRMSKTIEN